MNLYLVRHGESVSADIDPDQPLSNIGIEETKAVAQLLKSMACPIDAIMHSTKTRAKQTAEILRQTLVPHLSLIQREGLKPMDPVGPLLEEIQHLDRNVMLVSHLPFLEKLLGTLVMGHEETSPVHFSGSCVVCLEGPPWQIIGVISAHLCHNRIVQKHL